MPTRLLSIFGSYDFFGKTLPGTAFVIGLMTLLPRNSLNIPDATENILVLLSLLAVSALFGTLLGEVVHTIAVYFENTIYDILGLLREIVARLFTRVFGVRVPTGPNVTRFRDEEPYDEDLDWWQNFGVRMNHRIVRIYRQMGLALLSHREVFSEYLKQDPFDLSFTKQHLVNKATGEFGMTEPDEVTEIYPLIVSLLLDAGHERSFRMQSRYAFCRGMTIVLFFLATSYIAILYVPHDLVPEALSYEMYANSLESYEIGLVAIILLFTSLVFFLATGHYKRYYIEYLIAELYIYDKA